MEDASMTGKFTMKYQNISLWNKMVDLLLLVHRYVTSFKCIQHHGQLQI